MVMHRNYNFPNPYTKKPTRKTVHAKQQHTRNNILPLPPLVTTPIVAVKVSGPLNSRLAKVGNYNGG